MSVRDLSQRLGEKLHLHLARAAAAGQRLGSAEHSGGGGDDKQHRVHGSSVRTLPSFTADFFTAG